MKRSSQRWTTIIIYAISSINFKHIEINPFDHVYLRPVSFSRRAWKGNIPMLRWIPSEEPANEGNNLSSVILVQGRVVATTRRWFIGSLQPLHPHRSFGSRFLWESRSELKRGSWKRFNFLSFRREFWIISALGGSNRDNRGVGSVSIDSLGPLKIRGKRARSRLGFYSTSRVHCCDDSMGS